MNVFQVIAWKTAFGKKAKHTVELDVSGKIKRRVIIMDNQVWYGTMSINPSSPMVAGSYITRQFTYTVGRYGMDNGGRIRLLFRYATDAGIPQSNDPTADNYVTATTSNPNAKVKIQYIPKGGVRPWIRSLVFEVTDEALAEGDQIYMTIGDTSGGSKGYRAQTFVESDFKWMTEVECFETGTWVELEDSPKTAVIPSEPYRMVGLAPSSAQLNEPVYLNLKCEDIYGNPAEYSGKVEISVETIEENKKGNGNDPLWGGSHLYNFIKEQQGCHRLEDIYFKERGKYRFKIEASDIPNNVTYSNTIFIDEFSTDLKHYWGDLHAQYNNSTGTGSVEEAFRYARDAAGVDFVGHQPNDFLLSKDDWDEAKEAVSRYHTAGKFIPFLGYEWSGNTPAGGDRNVHFLKDDGPLHRTSHWQVQDKSDIETDRYPLNELYETFKERKDVLIVPHVGGRRCDITRYYDPGLEPVIEICSCHGRFEWLLHEALENGYTVGVIGGSDDHTGRPGLSYPTDHAFGTRGGLSGIYAEELSREGIFEAIRSRHTYATTGERIALCVTTADGKIMGDAWEGTKPSEIRVQTAGTKPIEKIEIVRNHDVIYSYPLFGKEDYTLNRIRIEWGGARVKGRGRHSSWNGNITIEGGTIKNADTFAFDHPKQGITYKDSNHVVWESTTSGDHDGMILELEGAENTIIHFNSDQGKKSVSLKELKKGSIRQECGGVGQYFQLSLQPIVSGPLSVDFDWIDNNPLPGRNAYWVRLVQEDGEMAWSSPLYFYKR